MKSKCRFKGQLSVKFVDVSLDSWTHQSAINPPVAHPITSPNTNILADDETNENYQENVHDAFDAVIYCCIKTKMFQDMKTKIYLLTGEVNLGI